MTTREDFGWHDDRPCPPWCKSTDHHLAERLRKGMDDFWHKGAVTRIPTMDEDLHEEPIIAKVYLSQRVQVDERGCNTHRAEVSVDGGSFTPANARKLVALVADLADQAEADTEWRRSQGFDPGPER